MMRPWKFAVTLSLLCSGCAVGPKYQKPVAQTPPAFRELAGNGEWKMAAPGDGLLKGNWWEVFGDPQLNRLEEMVDVSNQNLKQAEAQYREARAVVAANHAAYYPTIGASASITQTYAGANSGRGAGAFNETYSVPASASWEPDLWGRVKLSVQNAVANAQVSEADIENLRLSVHALVATDYFALAAQDMQLKVLSDTVDAYRKNLQLTIDRHAGGVASNSDIMLARTQLAGALAQASEMRVTRAQNEHAIATLTGQAPASLEIAPTAIAGPPPPIPLAMPSQLLERRPDIAATERQVAAANASVGLARAAYYPTLTLSASPGLLANNIQHLIGYASRYWSAGPNLSETLFDFGRRGATLANAEAVYDATVASYRQTVLAAFQEVEDDLSNLRNLAEESVHEQEAVVAAQQALDLEMQRYRAGTDSYLNVITTQIIALNDQQSAVSILNRRMAAAIDLIKALGGGWDASQLPSENMIRSAAADTSPSAPETKQ
ncbi:MAG TPA: efflux transporter outer membrane subunit [Bryobacteraceae bacterium]|nr:efflux transporter outer membrane subunit [Bryobacteraceae bacterium]